MYLWYLKLRDFIYFSKNGCFPPFTGLKGWQRWKAPQVVGISFSFCSPSNVSHVYLGNRLEGTPFKAH